MPLSVLSNWEKQIEDHVQPGQLTHCVYYGSGRSASSAELQKYDVVITTYQTVAIEHANGESNRNWESEPKMKKNKTENSGLFNVEWKVLFVLPRPVY